MAVSQRQKQKAETKKFLIQTAMEQFAKKGLTVTRTADIASAAKVSHGTIFLHFPTREILLEEVIEEFGSRTAKRMHELIDGDCTMEEVLAAHLKGIGECEGFYAALISEAAVLPEGARNALIMIQSAISHHILQVAERGMEAGIIKTMPFDLLFNTWIGLIHYYLSNRALFSPEDSVISRHGKRLTEHYMNLISEKGEI